MESDASVSSDIRSADFAGIAGNSWSGRVPGMVTKFTSQFRAERVYIVEYIHLARPT